MSRRDQASEGQRDGSESDVRRSTQEGNALASLLEACAAQRRELARINTDLAAAERHFASLAGIDPDLATKVSELLDLARAERAHLEHTYARALAMIIDVLPEGSDGRAN